MKDPVYRAVAALRLCHHPAHGLRVRDVGPKVCDLGPSGSEAVKKSRTRSIWPGAPQERDAGVVFQDQPFRNEAAQRPQPSRDQVDAALPDAPWRRSLHIGGDQPPDAPRAGARRIGNFRLFAPSLSEKLRAHALGQNARLVRLVAHRGKLHARNRLPQREAEPGHRFHQWVPTVFGVEKQDFAFLSRALGGKRFCQEEYGADAHVHGMRRRIEGKRRRFMRGPEVDDPLRRGPLGLQPSIETQVVPFNDGVDPEIEIVGLHVCASGQDEDDFRRVSHRRLSCQGFPHFTAGFFIGGENKRHADGPPPLPLFRAPNGSQIVDLGGVFFFLRGPRIPGRLRFEGKWRDGGNPVALFRERIAREAHPAAMPLPRELFPVYFRAEGPEARQPIEPAFRRPPFHQRPAVFVVQHSLDADAAFFRVAMEYAGPPRISFEKFPQRFHQFRGACREHRKPRIQRRSPHPQGVGDISQ